MLIARQWKASIKKKIRKRVTDAQKAEVRRRRAEGATLAELARSYDVSTSTIFHMKAMNYG
jgi:transposase-like protein